MSTPANIPDELMDILICPITCQQLKDPVLAPDGHTYERNAIEEWLQREGTSPFTRESMTASQLTPNRKVIELLEQSRRNAEKANAEASTSTSTSTAAAPASPRQPTASAHSNVVAAVTQTASLRTIRPEAFTALDELSDLITEATDSFQPPQVVVLGTESHGKSTILERLAGLPIFPRDKTLCTRVPVRVRFRRGPTQCIRMWEQGVDQRTGLPQGDPKELMQQASYVAGTRVLEQVRQTMGEIMRRLNEQRGQSGVSLEHEIVVQLQGPTYPDIDLVDLPGLVEMAHEGEDEQMPQKTQELTERYLKQHGDHSMFIVALDCRSSMHTSAAVRLLKEKGVLDKTLGVLTKCDYYHPEHEDSDEDDDNDGASGTSAVGKGLTELMSRRSNRNYVDAGYNWVLLSSKGLPKHERSSNDTATSANQLLSGLSKCQTKETAFFQKHGVSMDDHAGIATLCRKVTHSFERYIHETWVPLAISRVRAASEELLPTIEALGVPFARQESAAAVNGGAVGKALDKHVVTEQQLSQQLHQRLTTLLRDRDNGLRNCAAEWLNKQLRPLAQALAELRQARRRMQLSGGSDTPDLALPNIDDSAFEAVVEAERAVQAASQAVTSQLRQQIREAESSEHPVATILRHMLMSDESDFKLKRFGMAIDAVIGDLSTVLSEWTGSCAEAVAIVADVACGIDNGGSGAEQQERQSAATRMVRRQMQQDVAMTVDLSNTLAVACQRELYDRIRDIPGLIQRCEERLRNDTSRQWLKDDASCQRHRLVEQQDVLVAAEARLRTLLPQGIELEEAVRRAGRGVARPLTAEEFEQMLEETGLDANIKGMIRSVFDGSCGSKLSLNYNSIRDSGAAALGKALETNSSLQQLYLTDNSIGASGASALGKALETNNSLQWLDLWQNSIGDSGAAALGKALETNNSLQTLSLGSVFGGGNNIGDSGAAALGKALETNSSLQQLYLQNNSIGDSGAAALGKALETNNSLQWLYLDSNSIGDSGAAALGKALETNSSLQSLDIQRNNLSDAAKQRLKDIAQRSAGRLTVWC